MHTVIWNHLHLLYDIAVVPCMCPNVPHFDWGCSYWSVALVTIYLELEGYSTSLMSISSSKNGKNWFFFMPEHGPLHFTYFHDRCQIIFLWDCPRSPCWTPCEHEASTLSCVVWLCMKRSKESDNRCIGRCRQGHWSILNPLSPCVCVHVCMCKCVCIVVLLLLLLWILTQGYMGFQDYVSNDLSCVFLMFLEEVWSPLQGKIHRALCWSWYVLASRNCVSLSI